MSEVDRMTVIERWHGLPAAEAIEVLEAEVERLRGEWRKADDGWIACRQQLQGSVDLLRWAFPYVPEPTHDMGSCEYVENYAKAIRLTHTTAGGQS